jgi:dGTPase
MMNWKDLISAKRFGMEQFHQPRHDNRSEFQRDYDRIIFSAPFRRMQNKTQVFPLPGSVFVHNRLTHSLEVSSVGRSLGSNVSRILLDRHPELQKDSYVSEIGSIVSAACLAHDMGNPPFGHSGEKAISTYFSEGLGHSLCEKMSDSEWQDIIHFEGNANAFRLLTHQFVGRRAGGFALTYSTLSSIVKYPYSSRLAGEKLKFGFFVNEEDDYRRIADELGLIKVQDEPLKYVRHPLVYLVEAADDICYELMDIEDSHKLHILSTEETKAIFMDYFDDKQKEHIYKTLEIVSDINEQIAYLRASAIGILINNCTQVFVNHEEELLAGTFEGSLVNNMSPIPLKAYLKSEAISYGRIYKASSVVDIELAGFHVIGTLLELLIEAVINPERTYSKLLINRISDQYEVKAPTVYGKVLAVIDYISGMTDVYAVDFYRKIKGNKLPAV